MGVVLACVVLMAPALARPLLAAAFSQAPSVQSEPRGPPCPADRAFAAALRDEVPRAEVERAGDLVAALEFRDGAWQLELRRAGGKTLLRRSLLLRQEECILAATDAALIIDRYLRALPAPVPAPRSAPPLQASGPKAPRAEPPAAATGRSSELPAAPSATAQASSTAPAALAAPPDSPDGSTVASASEPTPALPPRPANQGQQAAHTANLAEQPRSVNLSLSAGIAGLASGSGVQPGGWFDLATRIGGWSFALSFAAAPGEPVATSGRHGFREDSLSPGTALLALSARPCVDHWLQVCAGPFLGARMGGSADAEGFPGFGRRERLAAVQPELGAAVVFDLRLPAGFRGGVSVLAGVLPWAAQRDVSAGRVQLVTALTLGYQLF